MKTKTPHAGFFRAEPSQNPSRRKPWMRVSVALIASSLCLSACTSLPSHSDPQVMRSYEPDQTDDNVPGPTDGEAPDQVLRGFFVASAHPTRAHQAARSFLTGNASSKWADSNSAIIVDRLDINSAGKPESDQVSYQVRGNVVGFLGAGGTFSPQNSVYESTIQLKKVSGQWRVDGLPQGVVMERSDFISAYRPYSLYFLDPSGKMLVPDRRWVYSKQESLASSLLSLLVEGPRQELSEGTSSGIPKDASIQYEEKSGDTTIDIKGLTQTSATDRTRVAAQIVWTLSRADVRGPYTITADGAPLTDQVRGAWTTENVSTYNPQPTSSQALYAVVNGGLVEVEKQGYGPVKGALGHEGSIESAAIESEGEMAAGVRVVSSGDSRRSTLLVGGLNDAARNVGEATTMTRPSWSGDGSTLWTTFDGEHVQRAVKSSVNSEISINGVETNALDSLITDSSKISELRVAHDGVRLAMIIGGHLYTAIVAPGDDGSWKVANPTEVAYSIGDTAVSVDWQPDGSLLVGTSNKAAPVWRVESDGSGATQLSARNVQAPVVAVAANDSTQYITDSRAVLQLESTGPDDEYWREVPSLQGVRAIPVIPR